MAADESTPLIRPHENGENGWQKIKPSKLIIQMPKDAIFDYEDFSGSLSLEELLPYQDDPWWQKLRNTIFYSFWFAMFLTLLTACTLAYMHGGGSNCKTLNFVNSNSMNISTNLITEASGKLTTLSI